MFVFACSPIDYSWVVWLEDAPACRALVVTGYVYALNQPSALHKLLTRVDSVSNFASSVLMSVASGML